METEVARLGRLLNEIERLKTPYLASPEGKELFGEICRLTLQERIYLEVWSERMLNQLERLFQTDSPDQEIFGSELREIHQRSIEVSEINDFFFAIVDFSTSVEDLCISLS